MLPRSADEGRRMATIPEADLVVSDIKSDLKRTTEALIGGRFELTCRWLPAQRDQCVCGICVCLSCGSHRSRFCNAWFQMPLMRLNINALVLDGSSTIATTPIR
ncbi:MAG: hypothetical protein R3E58_01620 [Phycisphaerae bacterium]